MSSSTAAPLPSTSSYAIARPLGRCAASGIAIEAGDRFMAVLLETDVGFERLDYSLAAWPEVDHSPAVAYWQCVMPAADQPKKKLLIDDETLVALFERLSDADDDSRIRFRFVLGLILLRKRLLTYEGSATEAGRECWVVRLKGRPQEIRVTDPKLDEGQIALVTGQLGQIMNEDFE